MRKLIDNSHAPAAKRPYIGHYGHLRKFFNDTATTEIYTALVASEKLYEHCAEINEAAQRRIDLIMPELAKSAGATEDLKRKDQLAWVGLMNACRAQADEIVKFELVYD